MGIAMGPKRGKVQDFSCFQMHGEPPSGRGRERALAEEAGGGGGRGYSPSGRRNSKLQTRRTGVPSGSSWREPSGRRVSRKWVSRGVVHSKPAEASRRVARAVRVREGVAPGGQQSPHPEELLEVYRHGIADFVEAEGPRELSEQERVDLVGVREVPCLDAAGLGEFSDQARRNELDDLREDGQTPAHRLGCCVVFHGVRIVWRTHPHNNFFCFPLPLSGRTQGQVFQIPMGW